jgi:hypothetical protein
MNTLPNILPETEAIRVGGITGLKGIADELNRREILTANGGRRYATAVANLLRRTKQQVEIKVLS